MENAEPDAILAALQSAAPSFSRDRKEFSTQELQRLGLLNAWDTKPVSAVVSQLCVLLPYKHRHRWLVPEVGARMCATVQQLA